MTIENDLRQWPGADLPNSAQLTSSLTVSLVRPQDLLALEVDCINLQLLARPARLERVDPNAAAFIIVKFPSQHVAEEVFVDNAPDGTSPSPVASDPPVGARLAGPSRLVFQVPTGVTSTPYTTQGLLNACQTFPLRVAANAVPPTLPSLHTLVPQPAGPLSLAAPGLSRQVENGTVRSALRLRRAQRQQAQRGRLVTESYQAQRHGDGETARGLASLAPFPQPPAPQETAIEFPFRLLLSPHQLAAWVHALTPVTSASGRTELWHTRLGSRALHGGVDEQSPELRTVRAIWTRDPGFQGLNPTPPNKPEVGLFLMALTNVNRHDIVHLSSNFNLTVSDQGNTKAFDPQPLAVNRLMLSALGAWADMRGVWPPELPAGLSVSEWRQLSTMGRDHYVRIVDEGFLYPFGHRAVLTSVSERKFHPLTPGNVAYVRQRQFLIVREPERTYGLFTVVGGAKLARQFPFTRVRITTLVTPLLNDPAKTPADVPGANILQHGKAAFWPSVGNQLFQFHMQVTDLEGHESELTAPMIYISKEIADAYLTDIEDSYNDDDHLPWRTSQMHGQKVAYAESQAIDDTTFETQSITFSSHLPLDYNTLPHNAPRFFPMVSQAKIEIPAIKHLAGNTTSAAVQFSDAYLNHGFHTPGQNRGGMFLDMVKDSVVPLNFTGQGDRSGGLVQPNMQISGLSRVMGPIAGSPTEIAKGIFNPQEFFAGLNAKVFGCINLFDIIGFVGDLAGEPDLVPKMITQASNTAEQFLQDIEDFLEHLPVVTFLRDILGFLARLPVGQFLQAITTLSTVLEDIGSLGTALQEDIATLKDDFKNLANIKQGIASDLETHLNTFLTHLVDLQKVLPNSSLIPKVQEQLQQHIAQFQALLEDKVQAFVALVQTLGSLAQNLYTDITDIIGDFGDLPESVQDTPSKLQQHLESFTGHLEELAKVLPGANLTSTSRPPSSSASPSSKPCWRR